MGPTWGPPGSCRPQMGPMLAPWTLLSGVSYHGICWQVSSFHGQARHQQWSLVKILNHFYNLLWICANIVDVRMIDLTRMTWYHVCNQRLLLTIGLRLFGVGRHRIALKPKCHHHEKIIWLPRGVVTITIFGAASDQNSVKMTTLPFQCNWDKLIRPQIYSFEIWVK